MSTRFESGNLRSRNKLVKTGHAERRRVSARTPWGNLVGYSRAVRTGSLITISGTTAANRQGRVLGINNPYKQIVFIIRKIDAALRELGASLEDVVRTRIYTTDITRWSEIARAHRRFFGKVKPACTMVQVSRLIEPDMLVEVEAEAVCEA